MIGHVDDSGRATLPIELIDEQGNNRFAIDVWIDTGFTGDLVVPESLIDQLELPISGSVDGILADGSQTVLKTYHCRIKWFGRERDLEVIANNGDFPLLGVGLLLAKELRVDYTNLSVSLVSSAKKPS
jgi:clan AA aspartic protease